MNGVNGVNGMAMAARRALAALPLVLAGAVGCSAAPAAGAPAAAPSPPRLVTARPAGSSAPGTGPVVIASPAPLPGGNRGSQRVGLHGRTLTITSVTGRPGPRTGSTLIELNLSVRNATGTAIRNEMSFFELLGPGGDAFTFQDRVSAGFYGVIAAHATRTGTIEFEVPTAAASGLYLMYRPETGAKAVLTRLTVS